ncbi:hypothetical protein V6948_15805, partial [Fusobacterium varium]|uniref:hypothetical protein n=1 Tax=Fusobacterium varium TaxID=856 RepID=UPI002FF08F11
QGSIDIDQAAGLGDKAVLDNVTVNVDKGNLVIGENEGNNDGKVVNNGFNASSLNLGNGSSNNSITLNSENAKVTLGGSGDGELVTVEGKAPTKDINVEVKNGTLVLGSTLSNGANQTLSASVTVGTENGGSGKLEVNAGNQTVTGKVTNTSGTIAVNKDAALNAKEIENKGTLSVAGDAVITKLTGGIDSTITVGDSGSAGKLVVETLQLNGGKIFLDPVWKEGEVNTIGNASHGIVKFDGNNIDGQIAVGQNSVLAIGDTDVKWAE